MSSTRSNVSSNKASSKQAPVVALVDCNNFYASCERVFRPDLENRPVVILSNNDGCVVARSNEAKELGVGMGVPFFQVKQLVNKHGVAHFSSNYALYGDMSQRVMATLAQFTPDIEVYSIDEAFLNLAGLPCRSLTAYAQDIRRTVKQWTGIPVSVGVAPTKVLAKIANRIAKKCPSHGGVLDLCGVPNPETVLSMIEVEKIWGIGYRLAVRLRKHGIHNAWQLRNADKVWIKKQMGIVGLRLVEELRGVPCLTLDSQPGPKKGIASTRSFRDPVTSLAHMREAIATFTSRVAEKLRAQHSLAYELSVFILTNPFRKQDKQYYKTQAVRFPVPTSDAPEMIGYALRAVEAIFRPGLRYKKAGVMVSRLVPDEACQTNLFDGRDRERMRRLMQALDAVNGREGPDTVQIAATGMRRVWKMRQDFLTQGYTTRWGELKLVKAW